MEMGSTRGSGREQSRDERQSAGDCRYVTSMLDRVTGDPRAVDDYYETRRHQARGESNR
jgi:hypothetical protein